MNEIKTIIRRRLFLFFVNIIVIFVLVMKFLNDSLMPVILEYGRYQCSNISTKLINLVVEETITPKIKNEIIIYDENNVTTINFNTAVLNSISSNAVKKLQTYFYELEKGSLDESVLQKLGLDLEKKRLKKGIIYEVPISRAFNNSLIANYGMKIPVRYQIIGEIKSQIVSTLEEYGINNALLEIKLEIISKTKITIPLLSADENIVVSVPLVMKLIQGEVPDAFLGTNILGGN